MSKGSEQKQKLVVLQTCIDVSWSGIKWLLNDLSMNHGDELILLGLLRHINPHSPPLNIAAARFLGYKCKEDPDKVLGSTRKSTEDELRRKKDEYRKNDGIVQLQKLYELEKKVKVSVEVEAGPSRKVAAIRAIKKLGATWVILDREMKKDKQYFMDRLSCGISTMKSNNTVVKLRGPIDERHVSYDEMIPSYSWEELYPSPQESFPFNPRNELSYCCYQKIASTSSFMETKQDSQIPLQATSHHEDSSFRGHNKSPKPVENQLQKISNLGEAFCIDRGGEGIESSQMEEEFENSVCSSCKNRRPKIGLQRDFTYAELYEATDAFSSENYLSEGGFGFVFQGILKDGNKIAVKQHKAASLQGEKEFKSEVHVLSQARHENLVMLLGSCSEESHRLLVYEYVCNGSLEKCLSNSDESSRTLDWEQRIKIAVGAAKGLEYLHAHNIVHRDMRPSNILITHDHEALLGDFGLAKAQQGDTFQSSDSGVVGTLGYVAPEYAESGKMSTKTDVYSFGMVLLQLITGLKTTDAIPEGKSLVGWAKPLLETKNYPDLIDKRIVDSHDVHQLFWMVRVAEDCLKRDPNKRCKMELVVHNLSCIREGNTNFIRDF
ncbi:putative serine/threonine-protein kinase PBL7 isoform X2 [Primulina tabacum]|uniref:putative serine/threonine-protein kinase PBL7 isoform X2 n=1 Tax=Primulina tabacum TaxID=48773 RepID=UPI003F5A36B7